MVHKKPDAYEMEFTGRPSDVVKCPVCGFRAVKYQFDEFGECPSCKMKIDGFEKGKAKKKQGGV